MAPPLLSGEIKANKSYQVFNLASFAPGVVEDLEALKSEQRVFVIHNPELQMDAGRGGRVHQPSANLCFLLIPPLTYVCMQFSQLR